MSAIHTRHIHPDELNSSQHHEAWVYDTCASIGARYHDLALFAKLENETNLIAGKTSSAQ